MKKWKIPVSWEMSGYLKIEANTLEEAVDIAENDESIPLPDGEYIFGSFQIELDDIEDIREIYNDNQKDEEE